MAAIPFGAVGSIGMLIKSTQRVPLVSMQKIKGRGGTRSATDAHVKGLVSSSQKNS